MTAKNSLDKYPVEVLVDVLATCLGAATAERICQKAAEDRGLKPCPICGRWFKPMLQYKYCSMSCRIERNNRARRIAGGYYDRRKK